MRLLAFIIAVALAGCSNPPLSPADSVSAAPMPEPACPSAQTAAQAVPQPGPVPLPVREGFEASRDGDRPKDWAALDGRWGAAANPSAPQGLRVMRGEGDADPGFSMLLATPGGDLSDLVAQVSFRMDCIEHPHGVGLVLHVADAGNYQIVRYTATESSWDFFTVKDGVRERWPDAIVLPGTDPAANAWTTLRVTSEAGRIEAFDGPTKVLAYDLPPGHATAGQAGLFLRGTSSALFDDFRLDDAPADLPA